MQVIGAYPDGDVPLWISGRGTTVLHLTSGSSQQAPANTALPVVSGSTSASSAIRRSLRAMRVAWSSSESDGRRGLDRPRAFAAASPSTNSYSTRAVVQAAFVTADGSACGDRAYTYAGFAASGRAHGASALLTALDAPAFANGHVAAWVGVGKESSFPVQLEPDGLA